MPPKKEVTGITISVEVWRNLKDRKVLGQSFDELLREILGIPQKEKK